MIRYLLGELSEDQTDRLEEQYFTDDETFDRLLIAKADLIDHYLHGQLDEEQTNQFESFFLKSPDHCREVAVVRSLIKTGSTASTTVPETVVQNEPASWIKLMFGALPANRLLAGACALLLVAGCVWLAMDNRRMHSELEALRAGQQTAIQRERELRELLATLQTQSPVTTETPSLPIPKTTATPNASPSPGRESLLAANIPPIEIELTPGQSRSSGTLPILKIPDEVSNQTGQPVRPHKIKLKLYLDRNFGYTSYAVKLKSSDGGNVQTRSGLHVISKPSGDVIEVEFSADKLEKGEYTATLSGVPAKGRKGEIYEYHFRIVR